MEQDFRSSTCDQIRKLGELGANFSPIVNYISSLGRFTAFNTRYLPRVPTQLVDELNPIPTAQWSRPRVRNADRDPEGDWRLTNPQVIMPEEYGLAQLQNDIDLIMDSINIVGRKYPKYITTEKIDYAASGSPTILVSSPVQTLRCRDIGSTGMNMFGPMVMQLISGVHIILLLPRCTLDPFS